MNSLNSILVEGNLTRDPELGTTPKGTTVCTFSIASNRYYMSDDELQKEVSYFDIETWARLAERCGEQLEKGRNVRVVGRLKQDKWNDKEGNPRSRIKIVAEHVEYRRKPVEAAEDEAEDGAEGEAVDTEDLGAGEEHAEPQEEAAEAVVSG